MYKKFIAAFKLLNVLFQAIYSLVLPIGIGALISFLLTKYASWPKWIWAVLMLLGTFSGLYSMIKFILSATANIDRMEKQSLADSEAKKRKEEKQSELRMLAKEENQQENGDGE